MAPLLLTPMGFLGFLMFLRSLRSFKYLANFRVLLLGSKLTSLKVKVRSPPPAFHAMDRSMCAEEALVLQFLQLFPIDRYTCLYSLKHFKIIDTKCHIP